MQIKTLSEIAPCLYVDGEKIELKLASNDALYSARSHAWREVFSSLKPKNICGQNLRVDWAPYSEIQAYKQRLIEQRGIAEIECELLRRGIDIRSSNYIRVNARFATL